MSLLIYSSNSQTLSHKISISSSKVSTFIYTFAHINRLSISTPPPLPKSLTILHPNYNNNYYHYTPKKNLIVPPISSKMATCVHSSRAQQPTKNCDQEQSQSNHHRFRFINNCRPTFSLSQTHHSNSSSAELIENSSTSSRDGGDDDLWTQIIQEAKSDVEKEPILSTYYYNSIVSHKSLERALANHLAAKLSSTSLNSNTLFDLFISVLFEDGGKIMEEVREDLRAVRERDPACISYVHCLLNFKGFLACQSHRIAHALWLQGRKILALLIQNRVSEVFAVDVHPGARIGRGILFDHATGVVIGETAVIGNNVSILHNVTLGGTGKVSGDRHPKIGDGVLIGAGTCVLGNVKIGDGAKIGACSVVLKEVPPRTTAVGNPARLIGGKENPVRLDNTPSFTMDHTSHVTEWSDYVI